MYFQFTPISVPIIRYVDTGQCDFLVDLETPDTTIVEPNFAEQVREMLFVFGMFCTLHPLCYESCKWCSI